MSNRIETELGRSFFVAGDVIQHNPTGHHGLVALDEEDDGLVWMLWWPHEAVKASECTMLRGATNETRERRLRALAESSDETDDYKLVARRQLAELLKSKAKAEQAKERAT